MAEQLIKGFLAATKALASKGMLLLKRKKPAGKKR
jgi:hypothetical protein